MKRNSGTRIIWWGIGVNLILTAVKWYGGHAGNSEALLADAVESSGDVFASLVLLLGLHYANRPADVDHPYGHGKAEPLLVFVMVTILVVSVFVIGYRSIVNIFTPHELPEKFTLWILGATIVIKETLYRASLRTAKRTNSNVLKSDAQHHRSDAITSAAALIGISVALWLGKGYESADDFAALLACVFILYNAYKLFRSALGEVMDEDNYSELVAQVRHIATGVPGVMNTEKCFVRKSGGSYYIDLHIVVDGSISVTEGHAIAHDAQFEIIKQIPEVVPVLMHVEPHTEPPETF